MWKIDPLLVLNPGTVFVSLHISNIEAHTALNLSAEEGKPVGQAK